MPDVRLATLSGESTTLGAEEMEQLSARSRGTVLYENSPGYDEARSIFNGLHDRRPGVIVRCMGAADVADAVRLASEHELLVSVRGGGHNVAGTAICQGGMTVDLSGMRGVRVDPHNRTVDAEAGCTWRDLDRETQAHRLVTPGGNVSSTGIAGLTLGGGMGYLRRKWGMTCDNLVSAEVVLADGSMVRASEDENPDLFWALRGGGGNFGIVTSFRYELHELGPEVYLAAPMYPAEDGEQVLAGWREFCNSAPDEAGPYIFFLTIPESPPFPEEVLGRKVLVAACVWAGPAEEGEAALSPLRELAEPLVDLSGPQPYVDIQQSFDWFFPAGGLYYWKTTTLSGLGDDAIDTLLSVCVDRPSNGTAVGLWQLGGALARVAPEETAYGRRDAPFLVNIDSGWTDPEETPRQVEWTRSAHQTISELSDGGLYLHYSSAEEMDTVKAAYGDNFDRLVAIKQKYDPANMFRGNQNIPPDAA